MASADLKLYDWTTFREARKATLSKLENDIARVHLFNVDKALDDFDTIRHRAEECITRGYDDDWNAGLDYIVHLSEEAQMWINEHIDDGTAYDTDGDASEACAETIEHHTNTVGSAIGDLDTGAEVDVGSC